MHPLSAATTVARLEGFLEAEIDGEFLALNIEQGSCYGLNKVGSRIWSQLTKPIRIGDIVTQLLTEYSVDPGDCERQVLDLFEELRREGLIGVIETK
jgi:hypothetical protein